MDRRSEGRATATGGSPGGHARVAAQNAEISPRERDIIRLVAQGLSNDEIGQTLHLDPSTIRSHIKRVSDRTGIRSRVHLAIFAVRRGYVTPEQFLSQPLG